MTPNEPITDAHIRNAIGKGRGYVLVLYKSGPATDLPEPEAQSLQNGHLRFIFALKAKGILLLAGPLADDGPLRGIAIMDIQDVREAEAILAEDPSVQAGRLAIELHPWFGLPGDGLPQ